MPAPWNVGQPWVMPSSFTDLVASFSNQALSPPCTTSANSISCGPPLTTLQPGAMLVEVFQNGFPTWNLSSQPGTPTTVSGLAAKVDVGAGAGGPCGSLGGDRSRTEVIPFPSPPEDYVEIDVCSRGVADAVGARVIASVRVALLG